MGATVHDVRERASVLAAVDAAADELTALAAETVRTPSVTGDEGDVAAVYARWMEAAGFCVRTRCVDPALVAGDPALDGERDLDARPNVYGWSTRRPGRPIVALNGHVDVIPAGEGWARAPFGGEIAGGRLWGRGAADMKGGLAAGILAARAVRDAGVELACDVVVQCVIAEESGGLGTRFALASEPRPAAAIVLEPTDCRVVSACGGVVGFSIEACGRAAHTSVPWAGASAFDRLLTLRRELAEFTRRREAACTHPLFAELRAKAPFAVGRVRAGDHWGSVPDRARMEGRIGVLPGEDVGRLCEQVRTLIAAVAAREGWPPDEAPVAHFPIQGFGAWETAASEPVVAGLRAASRHVAGDSRAAAVTFGSDASSFVRASIPVVLFGPGRIADAHTKDEFVDLEQLHHAARVLAVALLECSQRISEGERR